MGVDDISLSERDLRALRLFRSVVDAGGLTAAERDVGLERSTLSRQIKALEERLGAAICRRGPRGFDLTDFGRDVLVAAVALEDALEGMNRELSRAKGIIRGELKFGIVDNCITNPESRVIETLAQFAETAPAVDLSVVIGQPAELLRALHEFRINCCVLGTFPRDCSLAVDPLFTEEFRLYISSNLRPTPRFEELRERGIELILQDGPTPVPEPLRTASLRRAVGAEGLEAVAFLIGTGRYAGQLPSHYASALKARFPICEVPGLERAAVKVSLSLVSLVSRPATRAHEHMRALLLKAHGTPEKRRVRPEKTK
ncbi:MAG: LysR family transcriptional regulator [Parvibaculaceae bacterium]